MKRSRLSHWIARRCGKAERNCRKPIRMQCDTLTQQGPGSARADFSQSKRHLSTST
jgi:hypothetical protein